LQPYSFFGRIVHFPEANPLTAAAVNDDSRRLFILKTLSAFSRQLSDPEGWINPLPLSGQ
jgi:hypothetical protein